MMLFNGRPHATNVLPGYGHMEWSERSGSGERGVESEGGERGVGSEGGERRVEWSGEGVGRGE